MRLCRIFIKIFLTTILTFASGLCNDSGSIETSTKKSSLLSSLLASITTSESLITSPTLLIRSEDDVKIEQQQPSTALNQHHHRQQELKNVEQEKQQPAQPYKLSDKLSATPINGTSASYAIMAIDEAEVDADKLYAVVRESRDSRSLHRQFFIDGNYNNNNNNNHQEGSNFIRPKDIYINDVQHNAQRKSHNTNDGGVGGGRGGAEGRLSIANFNNVGNFLSSPDSCKTSSGNIGLCMRRLECLKHGGNASGFCGTFGVCCETNLKCNGVSKLKRTILKNPTTMPRYCTYHFQPYSTKVCQLRIDFDMVLEQPTIPDENNNLPFVSCLLDEFRFGDIKICGTNLKQHIYLPLDTVNGITDVSVAFKIADRISKPGLIPPSWSMIVTQLECPSTSQSFGSERAFGNHKQSQNDVEDDTSSSSPSSSSTSSLLSMFKQQSSRSDAILLRFTKHYANLQELKQLFFKPNYNADADLLAPPGCLQYFTERQGTFESFNYNMGKGPYMSNMRYGICFKRTSLDTGVQFSAQTFEVGTATEDNGYVDLDCHDTVGTPSRSSDYLVIPESILASEPTLYATYYCGTSLQDRVLHAPPGPFAIYFKSDGVYSTLVPEIGFKINYMIQ